MHLGRWQQITLEMKSTQDKFQKNLGHHSGKKNFEDWPMLIRPF
jgi:hypothetical protein